MKSIISSLSASQVTTLIYEQTLPSLEVITRLAPLASQVRSQSDAISRNSVTDPPYLLLTRRTGNHTPARLWVNHFSKRTTLQLPHSINLLVNQRWTFSTLSFRINFNAVFRKNNTEWRFCWSNTLSLSIRSDRRILTCKTLISSRVESITTLIPKSCHTSSQ